jgi:hypothetical protein
MAGSQIGSFDRKGPHPYGLGVIYAKTMFGTHEG